MWWLTVQCSRIVVSELQPHPEGAIRQWLDFSVVRLQRSDERKNATQRGITFTFDPIQHVILKKCSVDGVSLKRCKWRSFISVSPWTSSTVNTMGFIHWIGSVIWDTPTVDEWWVCSVYKVVYSDYVLCVLVCSQCTISRLLRAVISPFGCFWKAKWWHTLTPVYYYQR